ncbi:MAG: MBL fold metallo-hydrolase [Pseudomonadota bacterium]
MAKGCLTICVGLILLVDSMLTASASEVEVVNIRVGQGDSTLIRGPADPSGDRIVVLIDAGDIPNRPGGRIVGAVLHKRGITEVDHFIVTHYDADHIGGSVAGANHGRSFLLGPNIVPGAAGDDDSDGDEDWLGTVPFIDPDPDELGLDDDVRVLHFVDRGDVSHPDTIAYAKYIGMADAVGNRTSINDQTDVDSFQIDLGGGATLTCLAANGFVRDRSTKVANVNTENERSLSFLLSFGGFDYLISGDMIGRSAGSENARVEEAVGQFLQNNGVSIDVYHVDHHGADNGSEANFLAVIQPEIAVISVGNGNTHGHPNKAVLQRLVDANVYRIIQTSWGSTADKIPASVRDHQAIYQNDIVITTDGNTYKISTSRIFNVDG